MAYRNYMADMSMHTVNNLAEYYGGVKITKHFSEIIRQEPEEKRTADEIIENFKLRLNGEQNELI